MGFGFGEFAVFGFRVWVVCSFGISDLWVFGIWDFRCLRVLRFWISDSGSLKFCDFGFLGVFVVFLFHFLLEFVYAPML